MSDTKSLDEKKRLFKDALELKFSTENIYSLFFRDVVFRNDSIVTESQALGMFNRNFLRTELKDVFQDSMARLDKDEYIHGVVSVDNKQAVAFSTDLEKSKAYVISGESGSGKTGFAKRYNSKQIPGCQYYLL